MDCMESINRCRWIRKPCTLTSWTGYVMLKVCKVCTLVHTMELGMNLINCIVAWLENIDKTNIGLKWECNGVSSAIL